MNLPASISLDQFLIFALVLARTSGLVMGAPIFGTPDIPVRVRALLAIALALLIAPTQIDRAVPSTPTLIHLLLTIGGELIVGLTLGLGLLLLLSGVQLAGQLISQISGLSLADVVDPTFGGAVPIFSQLLTMVTLAVFVSLGGHRQVMMGLLDTFAEIPAGGVGLPHNVREPTLLLLTQSFELGLRIAAPTVAAQLLTTLVIGLISRTVPQLNLMALGFGFNSVVTFGMLAVTLGSTAWAFQEELQPYLDRLLQMVLEFGVVAGA